MFPIRIKTGGALIAVILTGGLAIGEEPPAKVADIAPAVSSAKQEGSEPKPEANEPKPEANQKSDAVELKEKPLAKDAEPAKDEKAAKKKQRKPAGGLDAVTAPLRALFGGGGNPVVVEQQPVAEVAENDPMVMQWLQQFRPLMLAELGFVRLVCSDLPPEHRQKVKEAAAAGMKQSAKKLAGQQRGGMVQQASVEPCKTIRDAISEALKQSLTEEQMTRFNEELAKRASDRKKASILTVVSRLDSQLFLTAEQRKRIEDEISSRWQDSWEKWLMIGVYGEMYFPQVPNECVAPHLNPEQKSVWNGLMKIEFWWFGGQFGQVQDNDGWWGPDAVEGAAGDGAGVIMIAPGF